MLRKKLYQKLTFQIYIYSFCWTNFNKLYLLLLTNPNRSSSSLTCVTASLLVCLCSICWSVCWVPVEGQDKVACRTQPHSATSYRIELVLALHVMLDELDVMDGLLQLEGVLLAHGHVTDAVIQTHHGGQPVVAGPSQRSNQSAEPELQIFSKINLKS